MVPTLPEALRVLKCCVILLKVLVMLVAAVSLTLIITIPLGWLMEPHVDPFVGAIILLLVGFLVGTLVAHLAIIRGFLP